MRKILKNRLLVGSFLLFISVNIFLYLWMDVCHGLLPFAVYDYNYNANHYKEDLRNHGGKFSLVNALGQYDSQWYLKIADKGYPNHPKHDPRSRVKTMDWILYNFFPLLPILIAGVNIAVRNIELSGFIVSNILLVATFFSLYYVVSRWFSERVAVKAIFLLTLYPFSIFLRGYYNESVRLLLFIWVCYFIQKKNFLPAALCIGLLCVTSGISLLLLPFLFGLLLFYHTKSKLPLLKMLGYLVLAGFPFLLWVIFCFAQTGNPFYFLTTINAWQRPEFPLLYNIGLLFSFFKLQMRDFYGSQIDVLCIVITIFAAVMSRKVLPRLVWLTTLVLAVTPLLIQDSISFARFTVVLFPYFVYLAYRLKSKYYFITLFFFSAMLLVVSLGFINWYWVE